MPEKSSSIGVQTDNPEASALDLMKHETMEQMLRVGRLTADQVITAANVNQEALDNAIDLYVKSLMPVGEVSEERRREIYEHAKSELVCDAGDHINLLRYDVDHGVLSSKYHRQMADLLDTVLNGLNRAANELTDNAFELKKPAHSAKLRGELSNEKEQGTGREGLPNDRGRVAKSVGKVGRETAASGENGALGTKGRGRAHDTFTATQRNKIGNILLPPVLDNYELSAIVDGTSDAEKAKNLYSDIISNEPYIQIMREYYADFDAAIKKMFRYLDSLDRAAPTDMTHDDKGREISQQQSDYFKDSIVRDSRGRLKTVWHGTTAKFDVFRRGDIGYHFGNKTTARNRVGYGKNTILKEVYINITNPIDFDYDLGSWDADFELTRELFERGYINRDEARSVLYTDDGKYRRTTEKANEKLRDILQEKGYDGISYPNTHESKGSTSYIVFDSNQAKSADPVTYDNDGNVIPLSERFNPESNDIRYSIDTKELLRQQAEQYGEMKKGEKPRRDVTIPKRTTPKTKVGQTIRTIAEAPVTPERDVPTVEELVANGEFDDSPYGDEAALSGTI